MSTRVLLVEDSPLDAELVVRELRRGQLDCHVVRVDSEAALRERLSSARHDVILADYNLPGFTGLDALRIARELAPEIPFIFVSGSLGEERAVEALREGAVDYIVKDRPVRLAAAVERALRERTDRETRERLRQQLERAERVESLGRLAATMAHEFNNVLMGIQPFAEIVRRYSGPDGPLPNAATQIMASVARGRRVTEEILRITRTTAPAMKTIDLNRWLENIVPEIVEIVGPRVGVDALPSSEPAWVRCDAAQLQQVVANLAINALHAMPHGGILTIGITVDRETVHLRVSDTGSGIPRDVLDRIFEPLFTTKRNGTGLGLAIVHRLVAQNGGAIAVESAPGEGTTFSLSFAAVPPPVDDAPHDHPVRGSVDPSSREPSRTARPLQKSENECRSERA